MNYMNIGRKPSGIRSHLTSIPAEQIKSKNLSKAQEIHVIKKSSLPKGTEYLSKPIKRRTVNKGQVHPQIDTIAAKNKLKKPENELEHKPHQESDDLKEKLSLVREKQKEIREIILVL